MKMVGLSIAGPKSRELLQRLTDDDVSNAAFRFMDYLNVLVGFAGLIVGLIATLIDARAGGKWYLSGGLLVLFGLFVAINL